MLATGSAESESDVRAHGSPATASGDTSCSRPPLGAISLSPSVPLSRPGLIPFPFLHILLLVPATRRVALAASFLPASYLHPSIVMKQT